MTTQQAKPAEPTKPSPAPAAVTAPAVAQQQAPPAGALARRSPIAALAASLQFEKDDLYKVLMATVMPGNAKPEHVAMLCSVALAHGLNPLKKEIYAFPDKGGGVRPIVSIDGWWTIANSNPMFNGVEFAFAGSKGQNGTGDLACTCRIWRKDREHPVEVTEYLDECFRATEPWRQNTRRMLRHRASIQCIRIAFGLAGVMDEEEYERMVEYETISSKRTDERPRTAKDAIAKLEGVRAEIVRGAETRPTVEAEAVVVATVEAEVQEVTGGALFPEEFPADAIDTTTKD